MPLIQPSNDTNITILDDEGAVIPDIDPTSALFWGRHVILKTGIEVHLQAGDFVSFEEGDVVRYEEDGVLRFKEGNGEYNYDEQTGKRGRKRKRKRMQTGMVSSAGVDEDTSGQGGSQAESSSSSLLGSEDMSGVDGGSERSEATSGESTGGGSPDAKKTKLGAVGRGIETEIETDAARDVQPGGVGRCDNMVGDAPMEGVDL